MSQIIKVTTDIARAPQEVFDYVCDAARLPEWQSSVESAVAEPPGVAAIGMRGHEVRRVPGGRRTIRWEVTDCEAGQRWGVRGIDGPVRAHVMMAFSPTAQGARTHVDYGLWFEGHGIGKLLQILARQSARREVPTNLLRLKQRLEQPETATPRDTTRA